jgi:SsrA-binding protein
MILYNKRAIFDYQLEENRLEAGISLLGIEAKSLRDGRGDISKAYVKIIGNEVFLVNANIPGQGVVNYDPARVRKLLLHRNQILELSIKIGQKKLQIVPIKLYNTHTSKGSQRAKFKLEIALGKSKKQFEKKDSIKKRELDKELKVRF